MSDQFEGISVFLAIAEARNFRLAGEKLGVTRSAVSQALQRLEDRIGVALVQRTTRSVRLTEAGEQFHDMVSGSVRQIGDAILAVREVQSRPAGLLKIAVSSIAERFISGPLLSGFMQAYPELHLDITITDEEFDIVDRGFDMASGWARCWNRICWRFLSRHSSGIAQPHHRTIWQDAKRRDIRAT